MLAISKMATVRNVTFVTLGYKRNVVGKWTCRLISRNRVKTLTGVRNR